MLLKFFLPLYITYAYRLIPVKIRKIWGMRGSGSSHLVIYEAAIGTMNLWPTFMRSISGIVYLPGYTVGSILRSSTDKGDALWHGKGGEKADWIPTT